MGGEVCSAALAAVVHTAACGIYTKGHNTATTHAHRYTGVAKSQQTDAHTVLKDQAPTTHAQTHTQSFETQYPGTGGCTPYEEGSPLYQGMQWHTSVPMAAHTPAKTACIHQRALGSARIGCISRKGLSQSLHLSTHPQ